MASIHTELPPTSCLSITRYANCLKPASIREDRRPSQESAAHAVHAADVHEPRSGRVTDQLTGHGLHTKPKPHEHAHELVMMVRAASEQL